MKLLIAEDNAPFRVLLCEHLQRLGFLVDQAETGQKAISALASNHYDALILDLGLPDMDGQDVLTACRNCYPNAPSCIVLTAQDEVQSKIALLNAGADDYVLKPVDIAELDARIKAVLRRAGRSTNTLSQGNLLFEPQTYHAEVDGRMLNLARREAMLLEEILRASPRIVVKDHLEERLYTHHDSVTLNAIEALVSRLRRKLEAAGASVRIATVRGIGYRLVNSEAHV